MITFNTSDFNLNKIQKESELQNVSTKYKYRIYGLKNSGNPLLYIEYPTKLESATCDIENFLVGNNIIPEFSEERSNEITIGIRKDLREHVSLSSALVQTIIYACEGRVKLNKKFFRIPGIPKFNVNKIKDEKPKTKLVSVSSLGANDVDNNVF